MKSIPSYNSKELFPEPTPNDVEKYSKLIEHDSSNTFAYFLRANAFARQKKYPESIADLEKVLEIDPQNPMAINNLGTAYMCQG